MIIRLLTAASVMVAGLAALVEPAAACPNGYEAVWIQGNKVCKIKTAKLPLKTKQGRELGGGSATLKSR